MEDHGGHPLRDADINEWLTEIQDGLEATRGDGLRYAD